MISLQYSCPGQLGKYQNGVVERRIKEIGRMGRSMMFTDEAPDLANAYCLLQAVDILNMLPSTANPADPLSNVTGFSPHLLYYNCIYLCRAHHCDTQGHIVWEYLANRKGRKLIVPEISRHIWNYFPMRSGPDKHLSNLLTFVPPDVCHPDLQSSADISDSSSPPSGPSPVLYMDATTDPMCPLFPDSQVILDAGERELIGESPHHQSQSTYKTRRFDQMSRNIGAEVRWVFFINGKSGPLDVFGGTVLLYYLHQQIRHRVR